jgi:hypothetical protein
MSLRAGATTGQPRNCRTYRPKLTGPVAEHLPLALHSPPLIFLFHSPPIFFLPRIGRHHVHGPAKSEHIATTLSPLPLTTTLSATNNIMDQGMEVADGVPGHPAGGGKREQPPLWPPRGGLQCPGHHHRVLQCCHSRQDGRLASCAPAVRLGPVCPSKVRPPARRMFVACSSSTSPR